MDTIIITGAGGFLGSSVLKALMGEKRKIVAVFQFKAEGLKFDNVDYLEGDLTKNEVWRGLESYQPAIILHLAAVLPDSFYDKSDKLVAKINRQIDDKIILFCEKKNARLIYASSTSIYGLFFSGIRKENDKCDPAGFYAREKYNTEKKILGSPKIKSPCILRINAPYGPGQKRKTVISIFIENALKNQPLLFHGSGSRTQDFTYVDDVASAFLAALNSNVSGIFNISGGQPISMRELALLIINLIPYCTSEVKTSGQDGSQESSRANYDISRAKEQLFWSPKTSLKEGLSRCIEFFKEHQCL